MREEDCALRRRPALQTWWRNQNRKEVSAAEIFETLARGATVYHAWWARKDLNLGPMDYESTALTAELRAHCSIKLT